MSSPDAVALLLRALAEKETQRRRAEKRLRLARRSRDRWKQEAKDAGAMLAAQERSRQAWDRRRAA